MTVVVAAVIEKDARLLVTRRLKGTHLEGYWEFPGGKCGAGESDRACLARELAEELGTPCSVGALVLATTYRYEDRALELRFYDCALTGDPLPMLGQEMRWVTRAELAELRFPPADAELIAMLRA